MESRHDPVVRCSRKMGDLEAMVKARQVSNVLISNAL